MSSSDQSSDQILAQLDFEPGDVGQQLRCVVCGKGFAGQQLAMCGMCRAMTISAAAEEVGRIAATVAGYRQTHRPIVRQAAAELLADLTMVLTLAAGSLDHSHPVDRITEPELAAEVAMAACSVIVSALSSPTTDIEPEQLHACAAHIAGLITVADIPTRIALLDSRTLRQAFVAESLRQLGLDDGPTR